MDLSKLGFTPAPWGIKGEEEDNNIIGSTPDDEIGYFPIAEGVMNSDLNLLLSVPEMLKDMIWFVLRCEKGEVRSKKTYAKFKATIEKACYPKTWDEIKGLIC